MEVDSNPVPLYTAEQIRIPPELPDILKKYTKHIIRSQPGNILEASADYFGRLAKQRHDGGGAKRLNNMQLEAFYTKFDRTDKVVVTKHEVDDACNAVNITPAHVNDVMRLGGWPGDKIPWLKFWALLVASTAGTLTATLETVTSILGDNGRVSLSSVIEVLQYLAEQDPSIDKAQAEGVAQTLMGSPTNDYDIKELLDLVRREIRPRSGANAASMWTPAQPATTSNAAESMDITEDTHDEDINNQEMPDAEGNPTE
ncbi:uncharacterized protein SPPG_03369 [Spizellomyces punctatus DAOM BR117]|uniref:RIIa domain-containing protein n=1 Tax=Spizellomyces punctatus (strain DAOM BR117) TaxID=645134 RepID=A0A0L0HL91_SPIPD|nr:uncharacterized protein SPPG_03369 [Spizellomyces punctatus DAOM BR117]KND01569.1 hypothetical protein SPPG_03369 [Spizellomyces punctatus DAOM BR117]|eukprot:XP_016609608.1 hypothetical protein SPPG_03369 [Spizellomyces punctatus DAOM BR117]